MLHETAVRQQATTRQQELVISIADFLDDWVEEDEGEESTRNMPFETSIRHIEGYGVPFSDPCDSLVVNAVRHYIDIVNPWIRESARYTLEEMCGFTKEESDKYYGMWSRGEF